MKISSRAPETSPSRASTAVAPMATVGARARGSGGYFHDHYASAQRAAAALRVARRRRHARSPRPSRGVSSDAAAERPCSRRLAEQADALRIFVASGVGWRTGEAGRHDRGVVLPGKFPQPAGPGQGGHPDLQHLVPPRPSATLRASRFPPYPQGPGPAEAGPAAASAARRWRGEFVAFQGFTFFDIVAAPDDQRDPRRAPRKASSAPERRVAQSTHVTRSVIRRLKQWCSREQQLDADRIARSRIAAVETMPSPAFRTESPCMARRRHRPG